MTEPAPSPAPPKLLPSLAANPVLSSWIKFAPDGQVIVAEVDLARLHDRLYRLETAVEDVDADLARNAGPKAYREAFEHLCDPARDLVGVVVEPLRE